MSVSLFENPSKSKSSDLEEASDYVAVQSHQSSSWSEL